MRESVPPAKKRRSVRNARCGGAGPGGSAPRTDAVSYEQPSEQLKKLTKVVVGGLDKLRTAYMTKIRA